MEPHIAYAMGRNTVWNEEGAPRNPFDGEMARHWKDGRRDAIKELDLDQDTEWDED